METGKVENLERVEVDKLCGDEYGYGVCVSIQRNVMDLYDSYIAIFNNEPIILSPSIRSKSIRLTFSAIAIISFRFGINSSLSPSHPNQNQQQQKPTRNRKLPTMNKPRCKPLPQPPHVSNISHPHTMSYNSDTTSASSAWASNQQFHQHHHHHHHQHIHHHYQHNHLPQHHYQHLHYIITNMKTQVDKSLKYNL